MLDLSDIKLITTIAEAGSINKAAEILNLSQPTVSKRLGRLEHKLGLELFFRDSHGMQPTEAVKYLQGTAVAIEEQLSAVSRQVELMSQKKGGQVSIGVGPIVEQRFIPKVLLDFTEGDYQFTLRIHVDSAENLLALLAAGKIDLAIGPFTEADGHGEFRQVLSHSERCACLMRQGHPLSKDSGKVRIDGRNEAKIITGAIPKSVRDMFAEIPEPLLSARIFYNSFSMAKTIVSNSDYLTVGPASIFHNEIMAEELVARPIEDDPLWTCRAIVKPETSCIPIVKEMIGLFGQYMDEVKA